MTERDMVLCQIRDTLYTIRNEADNANWEEAIFQAETLRILLSRLEREDRLTQELGAANG